MRRFDEPASVMEILLSAGEELASSLISGCVNEST
jgi:hypothetical protein